MTPPIFFISRLRQNLEILSDRNLELRKKIIFEKKIFGYHGHCSSADCHKVFCKCTSKHKQYRWSFTREHWLIEIRTQIEWNFVSGIIRPQRTRFWYPRVEKIKCVGAREQTLFAPNWPYRPLGVKKSSDRQSNNFFGFSGLNLVSLPNFSSNELIL